MQRLAEGATERFPFLYFSFRVGMLGMTFLALAAWVFSGFDVVEGGVPLIGIQWSTFATFTFFFWLLMVNFQAGGIKTLKQLTEGLRMDVRFLLKPKRSQYPREYAVNPWRALIVSSLVCVSALFAFEVVWVFLYDWFQFGSPMWPVYFAHTSGVPVIVRNVGLTVLPAVLAWLVLITPLDFMHNRSSVKLRLGEGYAMVLLIAAGLWLTWIAFPSVDWRPGNAAGVIGPLASTFSLSSCYVWPSEHLFPQNTYTFYPCALQGVGYVPKQILGFFVLNDSVHAVNVLTKFATFAAVSYPFMAFVRRFPG